MKTKLVLFKNWIFSRLGYVPASVVDSFVNVMKLSDSIRERDAKWHKHELDEEKAKTQAVRYELAEVRNRLERVNYEADRLHNSRFLMVSECGGHHTVSKVTEDTISRHVDLQDCNDEPLPQYLYLDADGKLYPVTFGKQTRINTD